MLNVEQGIGLLYLQKLSILGLLGQTHFPLVYIHSLYFYINWQSAFGIIAQSIPVAGMFK